MLKLQSFYYYFSLVSFFQSPTSSSSRRIFTEAFVSKSRTTIASRRCPTKTNTRTRLQMSSDSTTNAADDKWSVGNPVHEQEAKELFDIEPLDTYNTVLLNEVHPRDYEQKQQQPHEIYDLIAIGAGAGGLISSKQSARRGAKSCMISEYLAGGDCLNVGCVPSKALLRAGRSIREVKRSLSEFGITIGSDNATTTTNPQPKVTIDFSTVMTRMRRIRAQISPADGHEATCGTGAHVFQGRGRFISPHEIEVTSPPKSNSSTTILQFKKAVIATGGRPFLPRHIPGFLECPYTTNENLFNLHTLPPRMIIMGAGVIALEMAQTFASFGSKVTVIHRSQRLFQSKYGDAEAAELLQTVLEQEGVTFLSERTVERITTLRQRNEENHHELPLLRVSVSKNNNNDDDEENSSSSSSSSRMDLDCECLLVASGREPNVEDLGLEKASVEFEVGKGIVVNEYAQSVSNPNVYAVGDCVKGVPRLTHMSGEMAKLVIQNSLFQDHWKLSSFVIPACMYTEPEYATVGTISSKEMALQKNVEVDIYRAGLEHNDRALLESSNIGFCKIVTKKGTDEILGATIVADRAGEMINEISLAIKNNIGLRAIGRNIHSYPTTGEAVMGCGIQYINAHWERLS